MKVASSIRKAAPRKAHKERSQPAARQRLGLLEKKKDYIERATDFKSKQKRLAALRQKAVMRNKDEFYFQMVNAKTNKGVHVLAGREKAFSKDELALLRTQDQNYIHYQRSVNLKKMERLQSLKHIQPSDDSELKEIEGSDEDNEFDGSDAEMEEASPETQTTTKQPSHTIFVESEKEVKNFDPVKHFQTTEDQLKVRHNRTRISPNQTIDTESEEALYKAEMLKRLNRKKLKAERELVSREKREEQLRKLQMEKDMQKNLMGKGSKKKVGVDKQGLPVYKWNAERKR